MKNFIIVSYDNKLKKLNFSKLDDLYLYIDELKTKNNVSHSDFFLDTKKRLSKSEHGFLFQVSKRNNSNEIFNDIVVLNNIEDGKECFICFRTVIDEETMYEPFYSDKTLSATYKIKREELQQFKLDYEKKKEKLKNNKDYMIEFKGQMIYKNEFDKGYSVMFL